MKQKYVLLKDVDKNALIIQEFAELDKDKFSLLCEEKYETEHIIGAMDQGKASLVSVLRTRNLYPIGEYAEQIADAVTRLYDLKDKDSLEILFDDMDLLAKSRINIKEIEEEPEEDGADLDDMLNDDIEDDTADKTMLDKLKSTVKVTDEETLDSEKDT
jgi:hypothetical protein